MTLRAIKTQHLGVIESWSLAFLLFATGFLAWRMGTPSSSAFVIWSIIAVPVVMLILKFDYLNPLLVFLLPWFVISLFAGLEISQYARPLSQRTYTTLWAMEAIAVVSCYFASWKEPRAQAKKARTLVKQANYRILLYLYLILTVFNIAAAGYVPLIRGIQTGDPAYLDFGVHSIYGFYNAFACALGLLSFYLYLRTRRRSYFMVYICIYTIFVLFVTRGFILVMLVESAVLYCFVRGRINPRKLLAGSVVGLILFGFAGSLRSGDIRKIAGINDDYQALPDAALWLYAYSYFNVLNLDNVITDPEAPYYDGSAVLGLVPTVMRPTTSHSGGEVELEQLNVFSYAAPIYADLGFWGTVLFTGVVIWWATRSYQQAQYDGSFYSISKYSVLFFCTLFSFFSNFWLDLPIIFQILMLAGMSEYISESGRSDL